jgi:hypothetical protein
MALCALLFCVPFMLRVALDAGCLGLANEPPADRFFYSELIFAGDTVVLGVGYLINTVMRGVFVPVGASRITLRFVPFLYTRVALAIMVAGALLLALLSVGMLRVQRSGQDQPPRT